MKRLADRGSLRPPRRGYLAPCPHCGLEVVHSKATRQPVAQHLRSKACASSSSAALPLVAAYSLDAGQLAELRSFLRGPATFDVHRTITEAGDVEVLLVVSHPNGLAGASLNVAEAHQLAELLRHAGRPADGADA